MDESGTTTGNGFSEPEPSSTGSTVPTKIFTLLHSGSSGWGLVFGLIPLHL